MHRRQRGPALFPIPQPSAERRAQLPLPTTVTSRRQSGACWMTRREDLSPRGSSAAAPRPISLSPGR
jgi:hypothetical protein